MKYMQNKLPSGSHGTIKKVMSFILISCLISTGFVLSTTLNVKGKTTPNISVEKYVSSNGYNYFKNIEDEVGDEVIFKLIVDNTGETTLDLFVKDTLPNGLSYIQGSSIVNGYSQEPYIIVGNNLYWQFPNTVPQETVIITFHATVDECGIHTNKVNVTGSYNNGEIYGEDTAIVTADCWPVILVDKNVWNGSAWVDTINATVGETIRFNITISNIGSGPYVLYDITVNDTLPDFLTYADDATLNGVPREPDFTDNGNIIWQIPWEEVSVHPGDSLFIEFNALVTGCGNDVNLVNVTSQYCDPDILYVYGEDTVPVNVTCLFPDIKLVKTANVTQACIGETITYTYRVTNTGDVTLTNVNVNDNMLGSIVLNTTTLNPGEYAVGTAHYTVNEDDLPGPIINHATASGTPPSGENVTDTDYVSVEVCYHPSIDLIKEADLDEACIGETITYTYTVTNTGDVTLNNVNVEDNLLGGITLNKTTLAPGKWATGTASYVVDESDLPGPIVNHATATGTPPVGEDVNDTDDASVDVCYETGLTVEKYVKWDCTPPYKKIIKAHMWHWVTFKIYVNNTGNTPLNISVKDELPQGLTYWEGTANHSDVFEQSENILYWNFTIVQPGTSIEITFVADAEECGNLVNLVNVTGEYETTHVYAEDTATVEVLCPAIHIIKDVDKPIIHEGDQVTYTYTVTNEGNCNLTNVTVTDDQGLTPILISGDTNSNGWLDLNETWVYEATATLYTDVTNIGNVTAEDELEKMVYDEDNATVHVIHPNIDVTKTANVTQAHACDVVNYTIVVTNTGYDPLYNVYVNDTTLGISYYIDSLAAGESKTYYVEHTLASEPDPFENCVTVEGYDELGEKYSDSDCATVDIIEEPGVTVEKYVNNKGSQTYSKETSAEKGDIVSFKIVVNNTGDTPLNITVKDELPEELRYNNNAYPREPDAVTDNNVYWNFTNISSGGNITIIFDALALDCGDLVNLVNVTGTYRNIRVYDDDTATVDVPCEPNISVDKKAWNGSKWVDKLYLNEFGVKVRFNITVKNTGTVELKNITVIDTPSDCCLRDPTDFKPNYTKIEDDTIYWRLNETLKPNEETYVEFSAFVYCNVTNTAEAHANSSYGDVNDSDELPISREVSRLSYAPLSHDFGFMTPGETANTTFEIWNSGNGLLSYSFSENCSWVDIAPLSGTSTGEHDMVTVALNTTGLTPGNHTCNITIASNGGNGLFTVHVTVVARPAPPNITLLRPKENMLYINNKEITTFSTTLILGSITLHANATDTDGYIEKVEFYIDNTLEFNDTMRPYAWVWNEKVVGRHTITVKAYDNDGFTSQKSLTVTILML